MAAKGGQGNAAQAGYRLSVSLVCVKPDRAHITLLLAQRGTGLAKMPDFPARVHVGGYSTPSKQALHDMVRGFFEMRFKKVDGYVCPC